MDGFYAYFVVPNGHVLSRVDLAESEEAAKGRAKQWPPGLPAAAQASPLRSGHRFSFGATGVFVRTFHVATPLEGPQSDERNISRSVR
jgi:hypothetical protein